MKPLMLGPDIYFNDLLIELAPTGQTSCKVCHELISKADIRVTFKRNMCKSHYFHLHCFTPIIPVRVYSNTITTIIDVEKRQLVEEWVIDWNRQFTVRIDLVQNCNVKHVRSVEPKMRRALIECFKYLDGSTVVVAGGICREWYHVAWEEELWDLLLAKGFPALQTEDRGRIGYLTAYFARCLHCLKSLTPDECHMICPLTHRPKCLKCFQDKKYRPFALNWVKKSENVSVKILNNLQVPIFDFNKHQCIYLYMLEEKLGRYRQARALEVVSAWKSEWSDCIPAPLCRVLETLSEKTFGSRDSIYGKCEYKLYRECTKVLEFIESDKPISKLAETIEKWRQGR